MPSCSSTGSQLLDRLPAAERASLMARLQRVTLPVHQVLFRQAQPLTDVHFPINGVLSLVTRLKDGAAIEVTTIGNQGTTGVPVLLGTGLSANADCVSQVVGEHLVMPADAFQRELAASPAFRDIMNRYVAVLLVQVGQAVACNRLHSTAQRSARWLLMTHDRVGADSFHLTHEFLGFMLGVRRASVTVALAGLKKARLIASNRGQIQILDRAGLEGAACECYAIMHRAHKDLQAL
jgi:CRP-like cAMP-binding protein